MGATCCGCNEKYEEKEVTEINMKSIHEKRHILVEDVEEDILVANYNSREVTKKRRPTEIKDAELKLKVNEWFA